MARNSTPAVAALALLVGLAAGSTLMRRSAPAPTPPVQTQPAPIPPAPTPAAPAPESSAPQGSQSGEAASPSASSLTHPSGNPTEPLAEAGAKLQNEANTMSIVKQYEPGLVYVTTASVSAQADPFVMGAPDENDQEQTGVGSGFFVDDSGDILTNFHVVTEGGKSLSPVIKVKVQGQKEAVTATVVGLAPQYDLALIRPQNMPKNLIKPIPLGDSAQLAVGQKTVAMGAPFGFDFSVTEGIVSSTQRQIPIGFSLGGGSEGITQQAIQTDAAINPGNSGGPLLDSTGRVIGINTQIISPSGASTGVGQSAGVGFAIPINTAKNLLARLRAANGGIVLAPTIGVTAGLIAYQGGLGGVREVAVGSSALTTQARREYNLPAHGFLVGSVAEGTPAAAAGLRGGKMQSFRGGKIAVGGDVIVSADGNPIDSREDLQAAYIAKEPGDTVKLEVENGGKTRAVTVKLDDKSFVTLPVKAAQ